MTEQGTAAKRGWALAAPASLALAVGAGLAAVAARNPHVPGSWLGECPLVVLTGWTCPFCNGLRSGWYVSQGQWGASLAEHPLVLPTIVATLLIAVIWGVLALRGRIPTRLILVSLSVTGALYVGWMLVRNLGLSNL